MVPARRAIRRNRAMAAEIVSTVAETRTGTANGFGSRASWPAQSGLGWLLDGKGEFQDVCCWSQSQLYAMMGKRDGRSRAWALVLSLSIIHASPVGWGGLFRVPLIQNNDEFGVLATNQSRRGVLRQDRYDNWPFRYGFGQT